MDASQKIWFGNIESQLHLAVDKATKKVLCGWFEYEELTRGYFVVLFNTIINYGIPYKIKADNRSTFTANNISDKEIKHLVTQFGRVCNDLNIILDTTSKATGKANVERENKTFKDRLIAELRLENIDNIDDANNYLNETFIPQMNEDFSYSIDYKKSLMKTNEYSDFELKLIISEKFERIIDNACSISYKNNYYIPVDLENGEIINFTKGTKCTLIINYDGKYFSEIENHYYKMIKLENRDSIMIKETNIVKKEKKHHKIIQPENHPWRKNMMRKI